MKRLRTIALALLLVVFTTPALADDAEILLGLIPDANIFDELIRFRLISDYVSARTGVPIKVKIMSRYGDVIDRFTAVNMDGAFLGAFTGALAINRLGLEPLVRPVDPEGKAESRSIIFVRKDSGIRSVSEMQGKRIVFVDRATVTGHFFALSWIRAAGVTDVDHYFREQQFVGNHDSTVYAVLDNRADVGTCKLRHFNRMVAKDPMIGEELAIIARSGPFPDLTLFVRQDLPKEIKSKLRGGFLSMHNESEGAVVLGKAQITRFDPAVGDDYRPVIDVVNKAGYQIGTYQVK